MDKMNQDLEDIEFELWVNQNELFHSALKAIRWAKLELTHITTVGDHWKFHIERCDDKIICKINHPRLFYEYAGNPRANGAEAVIDATISLGIDIRDIKKLWMEDLFQ